MPPLSVRNGSLMSRTHVHTPLYVHVLRDPRTREIHRGCVHDPSGEGRIVGHRIEEIEHPAHFGERIVLLHDDERAPRGARLVDADGTPIDRNDPFGSFRASVHRYCDRIECSAEDHTHRPHLRYLVEGFIESYVERRPVPVRKVVECDIRDASMNTSACYLEDDLPASWWRTNKVFGRCACHWYDDNRRENQKGRDRSYLRRAAAEYNAYGELDEYADEPHRTA